MTTNNGPAATPATLDEPVRCPACGILSDTPTYCTDCQQSGQAAYDRDDRAGAPRPGLRPLTTERTTPTNSRQHGGTSEGAAAMTNTPRMTTLTETVTTQYVGPTDYSGSHFIVRFRGHTRRVPYSYEASNAAKHAAQWTVDQYVENGHVSYVGETSTGNNRYCVNVFDA